MNLIDAYYLFENLPAETKKANKFRAESRLDCTMYNGNYQGLEPFKNGKGMAFVYPCDTDEFIICNDKRQATKALTNGTLNLSSLYIENFDFLEIAYGYPNPKKNSGNGKINPLFEYRQDGYIFKTNTDLTRIEIFVFVGGRNLIKEIYNRFIDNDFENEIEQLRKGATVFYPYLEFNT